MKAEDASAKGFRTIEALWNRIGELRDLLELLGEVARDGDRGHTISDYAIIELR